MCFALQPRALFRHLNFQKWSEPGALCTFWLRNMLRAAMACTFSTAQLLKVLRSWGVLYILTWKCASRHNGVQLFISHLASWLRTRRFSEPTFRPSGATHHWKNTVFRDFATFSRTWIFFLLRLYLFDLLSSSLLFSDSSHLCCSSVHIVGSLTSKLPSIYLILSIVSILSVLFIVSILFIWSILSILSIMSILGNLSIYLSIYLVYLSYLSILSIYISHLSILSILSILSVLSIFSICLIVLSIYLSVYLSYLN